MGKKQVMQEALEEYPVPSAQVLVAKVAEARGNHTYEVILPPEAKETEGTSSGKEEDRKTLAYLPPRFRNLLWVRRGGYVLVDVSEADHRDNKLGGEVIAVLRPAQTKYIRRQGLWPAAWCEQEEKTSEKIEAKGVSDGHDEGEGRGSGSDEEEEEEDDDDDLFVNTNRRPIAVEDDSTDEDE